MLAALLLKRGWFTAVAALWVLLVCYSRIYLAYHFPLDILYGLLLGVLVALLLFAVFKRFQMQEKEQISQL